MATPDGKKPKEEEEDLVAATRGNTTLLTANANSLSGSLKRNNV